MSQSKYYTPSIEEFHVGFEYESFVDNEFGWLKNLTTQTNNPLARFPHKVIGSIRVKYLDQEDIESLGFQWSHTITGRYGDYLNFKGRTKYDGIFQLQYTFGDSKIFTEKGAQLLIKHGKEVQKFYGLVKNKSELKRILSQIGYEKV